MCQQPVSQTAWVNRQRAGTAGIYEDKSER